MTDAAEVEMAESETVVLARGPVTPQPAVRLESPGLDSRAAIVEHVAAVHLRIVAEGTERMEAAKEEGETADWSRAALVTQASLKELARIMGAGDVLRTQKVEAVDVPDEAPVRQGVEWAECGDLGVRAEVARMGALDLSVVERYPGLLWTWLVSRGDVALERGESPTGASARVAAEMAGAQWGAGKGQG